MRSNRGSLAPTPTPARAPRLRESCRAIRAALLASTALLALGTAAPAFAGDCVLDGSTIHCNGVFETPAPDAPLAFLGDDLTVVLGDEEASSVTAYGIDGIAVFAPNGSAAVINYGAIGATGGGDANAVEMDAYGNVYFGNYGDASAQTGPGDGAPYDVTAVDLYSYAGSVFAQNAAGATISASAYAEYGYTLARGLTSIGDNAYFGNYGVVEVDAAAAVGNVVAIGVQQTGMGFSTVYNAEGASILVSAESGQGITYGADAFAVGTFVTGSSAYLLNEGTIAVESAVHGLEGIATAIGAYTQGFYGFSTTTNYGTISAHAIDDSDEASYSFAYGVVNSNFYFQGAASAVNYGTIDAHAETYFGAAISYGVRNSAQYAGTTNAEGALIQAVSEVGYSGMASAVGVEAYGKYYVHDVNDGTISAYAYSGYTEHYGRFTYTGSTATGVSERAQYFGGVVMENSGGITAVAVSRDAPDFFQGGAGATGVYQNGKYYAGLTNSGDIGAYAYAEIGVAAAFGVQQRSKYGATTYVYNAEGASIVAEAHAGSAAGDVHGGYALANGIRMFAGSFALVYNDGLVSASASVDAGDRDYFDYTGGLAQVYGVYQRGQYGATLRNTGDIVAQAEAEFGYAEAFGDWMRGFYYAVSYNQGDIVALASADHGDAFAVANYIDSPGQAVYQYCIPYGGGCVYNYYGGLSALENDGRLYAHASAEGGVARAYGGVVIGRLHAQASNRGDIMAVAEADGGSAEAVALLVRSDYGDAWVDNAEGASLVAAAYGDEASASALVLIAPAHVQVSNSGDILAFGDGERIAIDARYTGGASIYNYGLIAGSILTGDGDDWLYNGEGARLRLADAVVDLGYSDVYGNCFYNYGTVKVEGASLVHMGHGPVGPAVPSLNANAFHNDGTIDFQDGEADDLLAIVGDFAGEGEIDVDVSGLDGSSDVLYVDGSVVTGSVQTINVDLVSFPDAGQTLAPMVYVTGDSVASNFVLGEVTWDEDNSFVTLDFDLVADIDPTNATPDVFALGIEVTGLSDPGTLAASLPGSVLGLMNSQVGTWRQRMGVIDAFADGAVALWARVWQDKGGFQPDHGAANFGNAGNFDWEQKNSGVEAGVDFAVTDEFSIGLLIGKSEADIDLDGNGHGSSDIDADTWGLYGTWISPTGFYLDASYRWMSFDVDMTSVAGPMDTEGDAESFNIELGYAWTLAGGLKIEPQLQYTRTNVSDLDALVTTTDMVFVNDEADSSRGRLGVSFRKSFGEADAGWLWTPYATISAVREFDGENQYAINDVFHGETSLEGTSTLLELGFTARHQNWSIYGGLNWMDGGAVDSFFGGQLGVRYTFGGAAPAPAPVAPPPAKNCAELDDDGDGINNCDDKCLGSTAGEAVGADGCPVPAPAPEPVMEPKPFRG